MQNNNVRLIFVDDLQATIPFWAGCYTECLSKENRKNLHFIKEMAKNYGVTIIVMTNVARPTRRKYPGPGLMDLEYYCPCAEDCADKIILQHRPNLLGLVQGEWKEGIEPLEVSLVKNKNGRRGRLDLLFDNNRIRVTNPGDECNNV